MKLKVNYLFKFFYQGLYYLALFFIFLGEAVERLFILFFKLSFNIFFNFFKFIFSLFFKLIYFFQKIKEKLFLFFKKIKNILKKIFTPLKIDKRTKTFSLLNRLKYFFIGVLTTVVIFFFYQMYLFVVSLPSPKNIGKVNYPLSTHLYDRSGNLLYEFYREQNRTPVKIQDLPKYVIEATVAIEDKDFYRHNGISLFGGIFRAMKENLLNKKLQGGSTITQQLVKTSLLTPEKTISRKIKEIILALWTERLYSKDEILQMYLNQVPYGGASYGIEEAAKTYFGKSAKDLTLSEAAFLAGLPQAPSLYSPYNNFEAALKRRNETLEAMAKQGYIDEKTKIQAQKSKLEIIPLKTKIEAPHFVFYVKDELIKNYGIQMVEEGGLKVKTTLDLNIQKEVERILKEEIEKIQYLNVKNGGVLVIKPGTGEILAMAGSVDYFQKPWGAFNVTLALRQPGSAIKPLMYSLALQERKFTSSSIIDDSPTVFRIPGSPDYKPVNYDGRFHGKVPLRYALANSYNIPAVKVLEKLTVESFIDFAQELGINTWGDRSRYGLSLALGGGEVKMIELAQAFAVLANSGYKVPLTYYLEIEDSMGNKLKEINPFKIRKIDPGVSFIISDILSDNQARSFAFGVNSFLNIPGYKVAVKTGTTDNKKDNWTIGYTPEFLVAVWVGNNDGEPMNPYLTSGITGASPIWNRVMSFLLKNYSNGRWYEKPENVVEKICYFGRKEYFLKGTEYKESCQFTPFISPSPTP